MPIYEYTCETCGEEFEHIQRFADAPLKHCVCGKNGQVNRKLSLSAFQLKGGGWYKEGYGGASSVPAASAAADTKAAGATEKKGDSGTGSSSSAGESKPASTAEKKAPSSSSKSSAA